MHSTVNPRQNQILGALPIPDFIRLQPELELVWLTSGKVVHEPGDPQLQVYFPTSAIISLLYAMEDGGTAEVSLVGNEGMVGIAVVTGGETMPNSAVVLNPGYAYRLPRNTLKIEFNRVGGRRRGELNQLLLRYTQALVTQMAQTAVCNRYHSVAQQLCRLLLLSLDRAPGNELTMTQELIANTLGVRREGITEAAGRLQAAGIIRYSRGRIWIVDRSALEKRACECYPALRREYERLLPSPVAEAA